VDEKLLKQALHEQAEQEIGDTMNRWNEIQSKLDQLDQKTSLPKRTYSLTRLLLVAVVLLVSAGVYAVYQNRFSPFALDIICEEEGFYELGISQTVDGVTVTIERAYADTSVIRLVARVEGVPYEQFNRQWRNGAGILQDEHGNKLEVMYEPDAVPCPFDPANIGTRVPDGELLNTLTTRGFRTDVYNHMPLNTYYETYYGGTPEELQLSYMVSLDVTSPTPTPLNPEGTAEPQPIESRELTFQFDFTVPVIGAIELTPNLTVEKNDFAITLTKVTVGKSSTELQVCYSKPVHFVYDNSVSLTLGNETPSFGYPDSSTQESNAQSPCVDYYYDIYFDQKPATLTFTISRIYMDFEYTVESLEKWEQLVELAAKQSIFVELSIDDEGRISSSYHVNTDFKGGDVTAVMNDLYTQVGILERIEGPWVFTVEIPE
jgi:hypothetical protein